MRNDFNDNEIALIERFDKKLNKKVIKRFPMVGGRLRLFHEDLDGDNNTDIAGGVNCEIIKYEDDVAVVQAKVAVKGNAFTGIGMASKKRDSLIFPAILELAETRAIARALRFAGYGVEYTGAEEMPMDMINGTTSETIEDSGVKDPEPHKPGSEIKDAVADQRAEVWEYVKFNWKNYEVDDLASAMKVFVKNIKANSNDVTDFQIYKAILSRKDDFALKFTKLLSEPEEQDKEPERPAEKPAPRRTSNPDEYRKSRKAASDSMEMKKPDPGPGKEEKRQKADIFMKLPAGVNANAFNMTLEALFKANDDKTKEQVYGMILGEFDGFVEMMVSFCAESNIDPGFSIKLNETPESHPDHKDTKEDGKKTYSDFRAQWINLAWKPFNTFILKNCDEFKKDESEYNEAVAKFDRLKVKNDAGDQRFPFPFRFEPYVVSDKDSILSDDGNDLIKSNRKAFPKMCIKVSNTIGILNPSNDEELKLFLEEFDHQVMTYETKHKKPYVE